MSLNIQMESTQAMLTLPRKATRGCESRINWKLQFHFQVRLNFRSNKKLSWKSFTRTERASPRSDTPTITTVRLRLTQSQKTHFHRFSDFNALQIANKAGKKKKSEFSLFVFVSRRAVLIHSPSKIFTSA